MHFTPRLVTVVVAAVTWMAAAAAAQPAPVHHGIETTTRWWSAQAGYDTFAMRDISRNTRPPDASPISWRGGGPAVWGRYEINRRRSAHLLDVRVAVARDFAYVAPTRTVEGLRGDRASRFEARYEYRRYFWRDVGFDGFDLALGAQGIGSREALDRHITPVLFTTTRISGAGGSGIVAARIRRWQRVQFDAAWANGAVVSERSARHSGVPGEAGKHSGGNLLSDTTLRAEWRLTGAMRLSVAWRRYCEMYGSSHYSYAGVWQSLNAGIVYAR